MELQGRVQMDWVIPQAEQEQMYISIDLIAKQHERKSLLKHPKLCIHHSHTLLLTVALKIKSKTTWKMFIFKAVLSSSLQWHCLGDRAAQPWFHGVSMACSALSHSIKWVFSNSCFTQRVTSCLFFQHDLSCGTQCPAHCTVTSRGDCFPAACCMLGISWFISYYLVCFLSLFFKDHGKVRWWTSVALLIITFSPFFPISSLLESSLSSLLLFHSLGLPVCQTSG